jgi:hypothetical protein
MTLHTQQQSDFIKMVASRLAEKFIRQLSALSNVKNYPALVGGLAEILEWSEEFYNLFFDKINDWEMFRWSNDNIHNANTLDDLIIAFGENRLKNFHVHNRNNSNYFLDKYAAIVSESSIDDFEVLED